MLTAYELLQTGIARPHISVGTTQTFVLISNLWCIKLHHCINSCVLCLPLRLEELTCYLNACSKFILILILKVDTVTHEGL